MSEQAEEHHELSKLGEFGLIDHLTEHINLYNPSTTIGCGDDAAIIKSEGGEIVVTTDFLIEGVHFDLMYTPLKHLGYKSVVVNISDICAMNGVCEQITMSIAISSKFSLEAIEEFYAGVLSACEKYQVDLVGGDTSSSQKGMAISVTAIGRVDKKKMTLRSTAKKGDLLCVSGDLGGAYFGLQLLEREKRVFMENPEMQPDLSGNDYIVGRQLKPEARVDVIELFKERGIQPTAMIDISDGLSSEIMHLSKASELGFVIYEEKLPIHPQTYDVGRMFNIDATTTALNGGEDYELLFTITQDDYEKIKGSLDISVIGYATELSEGNNMISKSDIKHPLQAQGWKAL
jgi:thiamine-monophosphate kinase